MNSDWADLEIDLLTKAIFERYGYDFSGYARASLKRRIHGALARENLASVSDLTTKIIHSPEFFSKVLESLTVTVTEMFRDPQVYRCLRDRVLPYLETYPELKVWHPGCATGEEVYSTAILLTEAGLYDRSIIYGTDINARALSRAREGLLTAETINQATEAYVEAGGKHSFSRYYSTNYGAGLFTPALRKNLVFSDHNLVTDSKFGEMNLILCRNVMIYFTPELQQGVLRLLWDSLRIGGFLCLGSKERFDGASRFPGFMPFAPSERIFQKKAR